jgi:hypothetical protein
MGKVPEEIQIVSEDFQEDDRQLVDQLSGPINNYILQLNSILAGQASITAEFKSYTVSGDQSLTISSSIAQPFGIQLVGWRNLSTPTEELAVAPAVQWSSNGAGTLTVRVIGLNPDDKYSINLIIFVGVA